MNNILKFLGTFTILGMVLTVPLATVGVNAAETNQPVENVEDINKFKLDVKTKKELPTLYLIGDSTVRGGTDHRGWGDEIAAFFDTNKINIVNHAMGGRSSRTFQNEGRWDASLSLMQKGDYLLIQFGHNDTSPINEPPPVNSKTRARGTIRGNGEETETVDNILTGKREVVHSYGWYLRKYMRDAKAKGVTPIICSPVSFQNWSEGKIVRVLSEHGKWAREAALQEGESFIDLHEIIAREYENLGVEAVKPLFADKAVHTTTVGAELNARMVIAGLRALPHLPLNAYLSEKGREVTPVASQFVGTTQ